VYQKAVAVARTVFVLTREFPSVERYSLTSQVLRSSRSVGAQIAEAWAKRRYIGHFIAKLTDAVAEQHETQHWVREARNCGYLTEDETNDLLAQLEEVGRMLHSMIRHAHRFCGKWPSEVRDVAASFRPTHRA
jgi:four helix bundle protein